MGFKFKRLVKSAKRTVKNVSKNVGKGLQYAAPVAGVALAATGVGIPIAAGIGASTGIVGGVLAGGSAKKKIKRSLTSGALGAAGGVVGGVGYNLVTAGNIFGTTSQVAAAGKGIFSRPATVAEAAGDDPFNRVPAPMAPNQQGSLGYGDILTGIGKGVHSIFGGPANPTGGLPTAGSLTSTNIFGQPTGADVGTGGAGLGGFLSALFGGGSSAPGAPGSSGGGGIPPILLIGGAVILFMLLK